MRRAAHRGRLPLSAVDPAAALDEQDLARYANAVGDRWPLELALVGGARVDDARGVVPQRERGPEYVVVLVSEAFEALPWLERVHQASSAWDPGAMGAPAEFHCYTRAEYDRRLASVAILRWVSERGVPITDL